MTAEAAYGSLEKLRFLLLFERTNGSCADGETHMFIRGIVALISLLVSIVWTIVRDISVLIVHVIGPVGVVIIAIAVAWWFGWLPTIVQTAASFFG